MFKKFIVHFKLSVDSVSLKGFIYIYFHFILVLLSHGPILYMFIGMDVGGVGTGLDWCDFLVFLHSLSLSGGS